MTDRSMCCDALIHEIDTGVLGAIQYNCTGCGEIIDLIYIYDDSKELNYIEQAKKSLSRKEWSDKIDKKN